MFVAWKLIGSKQKGYGKLDYPLKKRDRISITGKDGFDGLISGKITNMEYDGKGGVVVVTTRDGIYQVCFE